MGKVGLRVAVNTGEVVISEDYAAGIGDPLNVAARLSSVGFWRYAVSTKLVRIESPKTATRLLASWGLSRTAVGGSLDIRRWAATCGDGGL